MHNKQFQWMNFQTIPPIIVKNHTINAKTQIQITLKMKEQIQYLWTLMSYYDANYQQISDATGKTIYSIKKQLIGCIILNIWRLCKVARAKNISKLNFNIIQTDKLKYFSLSLIQIENYRKMKKQYLQFLSYLSNFYSDEYYYNVNGQNIEQYYKQMIKMAFDLQILNIHRLDPNCMEYIELNKNIAIDSLGAAIYKKNKKAQKKIVDLISDDQQQIQYWSKQQLKAITNMIQQINYEELFNKSISTNNQVYFKQIQQNSYGQQQIRIAAKCYNQLIRQLSKQPNNYKIKQQLAKIAVKLTVMKLHWKINIIH